MLVVEIFNCLAVDLGCLGSLRFRTYYVQLYDSLCASCGKFFGLYNATYDILNKSILIIKMILKKMRLHTIFKSDFSSATCGNLCTCLCDSDRYKCCIGMVVSSYSMGKNKT